MRADGTLVSLAEQDRGTRDAGRIGDGLEVLERALRIGRPGPYIAQAAIAALHAQAPSWAETDWAQIAGLYAGLAILDGLAADPRLDGYQPLHAARAAARA